MVTTPASLTCAVATFGVTSTGRRVRLLGATPQTRCYEAGFEVGVSFDETDGQWRLSWLPQSEIVEIELVEEQ